MKRFERVLVVVLVLGLAWGVLAATAARACTNKVQGGAAIISFDHSDEGLVEVFFEQPTCGPAVLVVTAGGLHSLGENATGNVVDGDSGEIGLRLPEPYTGVIRVYWVLVPIGGV